jgi:chromosome segregation ATPase
MRNAINRMDRDIKQLENAGDSNNGRLQMFGDRLNYIIPKINNAKFRSGVYGPIGMMVKMAPNCQNESNAVEKVLWSVLRTFVVDNQEDRKTLVQILRSERADSVHPIVIQQNRPRYIIKPSPNSDVTLVSDAIVIENDLIFNAVIDQCGIDKIAIVKSEEDCMRNYVENINGREMLKYGIRKAMTYDGTTIKFVYGNKACEMNNFPYKRLLASDTSEILYNLRLEYNDEMNKLQHNENELRQVILTIDNIQNNIMKTEKNLINSNNKIINEKKVLQELQENLTDMQTSSNIDYTHLEKEIDELNDVNIEITKRINIIKEQYNNTSNELQQYKNEKNQLDIRKKELINKLADEELKMEEYVNVMENRKKEINKKTNAILSAQKVLDGTQKLIDNENKKLDNLIKIANEETAKLLPQWDGVPLELSRRDSKQNLENAITRIKAKIEQRKKKDNLMDISLSELMERLERAANDYNEHFNIHKEMKEKVKRLTNDNQIRKDKWEEQIRMYGKMVAVLFNTYMNHRGFSGTVYFNHDEKKLHIKSQTDSADESSRCDNVRQLSGGERSYTTLCLLMALGHVVS